MSDLHSSLKTDLVGRAEAHGTDWALARLQHGKDNVTFSLHANPRTFSTAGVQLTDTLSLLGFRRSSCAFFHGQCYVRAVDGSLELEQFAQAFPQIHDAVKQADGHLAACGIVLERPEGVGYFFGKSSGGRRRQDRPSGDGHTSPKTTRLGEADDDHFRYAFTWVEGGADKGWTTHYRPKHPPLSPEMESAFRHLGLHAFASCAEFDFDPCHRRSLAYEQRGDSIFHGNADYAHSSFRAHAQQFSPGLQQLLNADALARRFGMAVLPPSPQAGPRGQPAGSRPGSSPTASGRSTGPSPSSPPAGGAPQYDFDVAITFAGTERELAEELATLARDAGLRVFYDDFYPEQLWGKNLPEFFDDIYRKRPRYCLMLVSPEYAERMRTTHERRSAQARALQEKGNEYILPIEVAKTDLPGMPPTVGYLPLAKYSPEQIVRLLVKKLKG